MPALAVLGAKTLLVLAPALWLAARILPGSAPEAAWAGTLFLALLASNAAFWLGVVLNLPAGHGALLAAYFLVLATSHLALAGLPRGPAAKPAPGPRATGHGLALLVMAAAIGYFLFTAGRIPTGYGMYFHSLDLLKHAEETGRLYPPFPADITFNNYLLTILVAQHGLAQLLGLGLGLSGHVQAHALIQALYAAGFCLALVAATLELWGSRLLGLALFLLAFLGLHQEVTVANLLRLSTKELTSPFLLGFAAFLLLRIFRQRSGLNEIWVLGMTGLLLVASRPYNLPFVLSFGLAALLLTLAGTGRGFAAEAASRLPFFLPAAALTCAIYILNLAHFGHPLPIAAIHGGQYQPSGASYALRLLDTLWRLLQENLPLAGTAIFGPGQASPHVSLLVSSLALLGLGPAIQDLARWAHPLLRRRLAALGLGLAGAVALTALFLSPKFRIYWPIPFVLLLAGAALHAILRRRFKALLPALAAMAAALLAAPNPGTFLSPSAVAYDYPMTHAWAPFFQHNQTYQLLVREAVLARPGVQVMTTTLEPGLSDLNQAPGLYFWDAFPFPRQGEAAFTALGWNPERCIAFLRERRIGLITTSVPPGANFYFLEDAENSRRFWDLLASRPDAFARVAGPVPGAAGDRAVYALLPPPGAAAQPPSVPLSSPAGP